MPHDLEIVDLSFAIASDPSCSFEILDTAPQVSFQEGDGGGAISVRLDNLVMSSYTHVSFPGSDPSRPAAGKTVGEYPLERFVGPVAIVDVSRRSDAVAPFFDAQGTLQVEPRDEASSLAFLESLAGLAVTSEDLLASLRAAGVALRELRGVLFFSGLSRYWKYQKFQAWEHRYFFNPFPTPELCRELAGSGISFVGIDSLQLEPPIGNFLGQELPFILNPACRRYIARQRADGLFNVARSLFAGDVLIYQNLNLPSFLAGRCGEFFGVPLNLRVDGASSAVRPFVRMPPAGI